MDSLSQFLAVSGWVVGLVVAYIAIFVISRITSKVNQRDLWQDYSKDSVIYNPDDWS